MNPLMSINCFCLIPKTEQIYSQNSKPYMTLPAYAQSSLENSYLLAPNVNLAPSRLSSGFLAWDRLTSTERLKIQISNVTTSTKWLMNTNTTWSQFLLFVLWMGGEGGNLVIWS